MRWFILCLRKYVDFKGRARRKEFWLFTLFYLIALVIPPAVIIPIAVIYRHTIDIAGNTGNFFSIATGLCRNGQASA